MKHTILMLMILACLLTTCTLASGTQTIDISITSSGTGLLVTEEIQYTHDQEEPLQHFSFWADTEATEVQIILVGSNTPIPRINNGNIYTANLTTGNLSLTQGEQASYQITYHLPALETFNKVLQRETTSLTVTYKTKELYQGEDLLQDSRHHIRLYLPTEAPLNSVFIGLVVILVVLLMFMVLLFIRKQRQRTRKILNESQELLTTKKALLLSILKDIEKQHRSKDISDDTYSKLKEEYKQDAVEVMKQLDDIEKQ